MTEWTGVDVRGLLMLCLSLRMGSPYYCRRSPAAVQLLVEQISGRIAAIAREFVGWRGQGVAESCRARKKQKNIRTGQRRAAIKKV